MINRFFRRFIPGKAESITVKVVPSDTGMLFVRLCVNDRMRAQIKCVRQSQTTILIGDILHNNEDFDYNRGYGSAMMEKLLDYARGNGITYIHGNLS